MSAPTAASVRAALNDDPVWAAYAIADLQLEHAAFCQWRIAETGSGAALTLVYTRLDTPILFTMGAREALAMCLASHDLPVTIYISAREDHFPVVARFFDFANDVIPMWRMALRRPSARMPEPQLPPNTRLVQLTPDDAPRIRQLHANGGPFTPDMFMPHQIERGVFFGVESENGALLASGGTHVADWEAGVAAIGVMYTHAAYRGHGFASAVLRAIVARLQHGGVDNIVLNVDQRNNGAILLYERHGFELYCPYVEGYGTRVSDRQI